MSIRRKKFLFLALTAANLALIWGNSLMTGESSGNFSGAVVAFLSRFLPFFSGEMGHTLLRKLAHFCEFACLGLLMGTTLRFYGKPVFRATGLGLAAACVDETIQLFVPGRASSLIDVWIDTAGFATGLLILMLGYTFTRKSHRNSHS